MLRHAPETSPLFSALLAWGCHGDQCADTAAGSTSSPGAAALLCVDCHVSNAAAEQESLHQAPLDDVATELAEARVGETPDDVLNGGEPENSIACHAPHSPDEAAYFNSSTRTWQPVDSMDELCGQCHGSLRISSTDHLSYDVRSGTGGVGVADQQIMGNVACVDCHMFVEDVDGSTTSMQHGHGFTVHLEGSANACLACHPGMGVASAVEGYQADLAELEATTAANVEAATDLLVGSGDDAALAELDAAIHNLELAEGDESGGFHNHSYLMALLDDANDRALSIISVR